MEPKKLYRIEQGKMLSAAQLNRIAKTGDARKRISELRRIMTISDLWVTRADGVRYKVYFIPHQNTSN